jgi:hypothetical protein
LEAGAVATPEQLRIVQRDAEKAAAMQCDPTFGTRVVQGAVQDYLTDETSAEFTADGRYAGLYLDMCGTVSAQLLPALEALLGRMSQRGGGPCVLGVTWCARDPMGNTSEESECRLQRLLMQGGGTVCLAAEGEFGNMRTRFYVCERGR